MTTRSLDTLLPVIDPVTATAEVVVDTAEITWSDATLRDAVVVRFQKLGERATTIAERLTAPPSARNGFVQSNTAVVTSVVVLEAIGAGDAVALLSKLAADARPVAVAHASAALRRLGREVPAREPPPATARAELERQVAEGKPKERELAVAELLRHADLAVLPAVRAALADANAVVREQAALTCARLGDAACFDVLLERLRHRPAPKPGARGLTAEARDALAAWNALAELGDVRAFAAIKELEADVRYARLRFDHAQGVSAKLFERHPAARHLA